MPCFVTPDKYIYSVEEEFNGVVIKGNFYDKQFMFGRGAGGYPTGSAVLSDITARGHDYKYEYKKLNHGKKLAYTTNWDIKIYVRYSREEDIQKFKFKEISERYWSERYKFTIGTISLADLIDMRDELKSMDIFVAKLYENNLG